MLKAERSLSIFPQAVQVFEEAAVKAETAEHLRLELDPAMPVYQFFSLTGTVFFTTDPLFVETIARDKDVSIKATAAIVVSLLKK